MGVRKARLVDASALSELVNRSAVLVRDDLNDQGRILVDSANAADEFAKRLVNPEYLLLCFEQEQNLLGMISIFQFQKIDQLFVDPRFLKRGIARKLWENAYIRCNRENETGYYWVRSSSMAVSVYVKFGFSKKGSIQTKNGISHQLLELKTGNSSI